MLKPYIVGPGLLYRDFGADTPIAKIAPDGLISHFEELTAEKALGKKPRKPLREAKTGAKSK